ncbi:hypothetical protein AZE42_10267 [Rhizopogon vesiculosus]|uniref:Uncharacterized protein n=1 Tax=Rhizopogon vesiculosus TaxID=180088 RepID=A0A1J8PYQ4_9AGAM|nr:hypothetical protein AZE42_10267 [Rhizopogon vesiculosus]
MTSNENLYIPRENHFTSTSFPLQLLPRCIRKIQSATLVASSSRMYVIGRMSFRLTHAASNF